MFNRAVELNPAQDSIRYNLAVAQYKNNDKEAALKHYFVMKNKNSRLAESLFRVIYSDKLVFVGKWNFGALNTFIIRRRRLANVFAFLFLRRTDSFLRGIYVIFENIFVWMLWHRSNFLKIFRQSLIRFPRSARSLRFKKRPRSTKLSSFWTKISRTSITKESAVRCAVGNRRRRAAGAVPIATRPNIFTADVIKPGILLKHAENVRTARINGVGHRAWAVTAGQNIKIGM